MFPAPFHLALIDLGMIAPRFVILMTRLLSRVMRSSNQLWQKR